VLRVGFDATSLLGSRTGVGQVAAGMLGTLSAHPELEMEAFAVTWRGHHDLAAAVPPGTRVSERRMPARVARALWSRVGRPSAEFWTGDVDLVHAPNYVAPPARAAVLVSVYDLTFMHYPAMCTVDVRAYGRHLRRALDQGATVHTTSDFVANEIRDHFGLQPERVARIYPGLTTSTGGDPERGRVRAGAPDYVLALGTVEPRKNLPGLVRAFDALAPTHPGLGLVIAGPDGWGAEDLARAITVATHADRIHRLGYVDDAGRRDLLAGASALAYPSLYEGFGLPPLEAMSTGVPVVATTAGSLPEVLGDAALLTDPADDDELAGALERILSEPDTRNSLVARGLARAEQYTWDRTGDDLLALYRTVAGDAG